MCSAGPTLLPLLRSQTQARLLTWVFFHPEEEFRASELAGYLGAPRSSVRRMILRLAEVSIVRTRTLARSRLVQANLAHPAARAISQILEIEHGPRTVLAKELALPGVEIAVLFGAWATPFESRHWQISHEIDVLVIGQISAADVRAAMGRVRDRLGLQVNLTYYQAAPCDVLADSVVARIAAANHTVVVYSHSAAGAPKRDGNVTLAGVLGWPQAPRPDVCTGRVCRSHTVHDRFNSLRWH